MIDVHTQCVGVINPLVQKAQLLHYKTKRFHKEMEE